MPSILAKTLRIGDLRYIIANEHSKYLFIIVLIGCSLATICTAAGVEVGHNFEPLPFDDNSDYAYPTISNVVEIQQAPVTKPTIPVPPVPLPADSTNTSDPKKELGFIHAFIASISVILVSELGDKTFFIAAIMAMRHPRLTVFTGAIAALALMTILSAFFGMAATIIPRVYTYYISTALFAIFGLKMLKEGYYMSPNEGQDELEEVQSDIKKRDEEREAAGGPSATGITTVTVAQTQDDESVEGGRPAKGTSTKQQSVLYMAWKIFAQAFTMTFLAEWGDRSQLTTIILSATENVYGVIVGGVLGHSVCTGLAVIGGRMIAQKISVRTVTLVGGVVFILFAISALFFDPNDE